MKILLIGGTGLISTAIVHQLVERGDEVTVYNRGVTPWRIPKSVQVIKGNRWDYPAFENQMRDVKADAEAGMSTLSVRMGAGRAAVLFRASLVLAYLAVAAFALARVIPIASLLALASAPYAFLLAGRITGPEGVPPNSAELVSRFAIVFGALLAIGVAWIWA